MTSVITDSGGVSPGSATAARPIGWTRADTARTILALTLAAGLAVTATILHNAAGSAPATSLLIGAALGIVFERGRFCFYCIFRDLFEKKNSRGSYSILTALAVGSVGYAIVFAMRLPAPVPGSEAPGAHVGPVSLALVVAGVVFGLGVVISGGCIAGHLYRLGEGSLRAIPALAGALVGFGLGFATWNPIARLTVLGAPAPWLPAAAGYVPALVLQLGVLTAIGVALLRWNPPQAAQPERVITATEIRRSLFFKRWPTLLTGALVGLIGVIAYLRVGPLGVTSQLSSATRTVLDDTGWIPETLVGIDGALAGCVALVIDTITDNGWLIIGILVGSLAAALPGRRFRLEPVGARGSGAALLGGIMIGWSAVIGLGCTVGVFLSGIQAFAVSGWVFAIALVSGLAVGFALKLNRF